MGHCPKCRGRLVRRTNSRTGIDFAGCVKFPKCDGTRSLQDPLNNAYGNINLFWDDEHGNSRDEEDFGDEDMDAIDTEWRWDTDF